MKTPINRETFRLPNCRKRRSNRQLVNIKSSARWDFIPGRMKKSSSTDYRNNYCTQDVLGLERQQFCRLTRQPCAYIARKQVIQRMSSVGSKAYQQPSIRGISKIPSKHREETNGIAIKRITCQYSNDNRKAGWAFQTLQALGSTKSAQIFPGRKKRNIYSVGATTYQIEKKPKPDGYPRKPSDWVKRFKLNQELQTMIRIAQQINRRLLIS